MAGTILLKNIDQQSDGFIQKIKEAAHLFAIKKLKNSILINQSYHQSLNLYPCLEHIFKQATHFTLSQYIQKLLENHAAFLDSNAKEELALTLKNQCEQIIAKILLATLSDFKNNKTIDVTIHRMLLGISEQTIALYSKEDTENSVNDDVSSIVACLQSFINQTSVFSHQNEVLHSIPIKTALDYVEYKVKRHLASSIQEITSSAISRALKAPIHG